MFKKILDRTVTVLILASILLANAIAGWNEESFEEKINNCHGDQECMEWVWKGETIMDDPWPQ